VNCKRKSRRRFFLLMLSRTPPISSEFRGGGCLNTPTPPRYATDWYKCQLGMYILSLEVPPFLFESLPPNGTFGNRTRNSQLYVQPFAHRPLQTRAHYPAAGCRCDGQQVAVFVFCCAAPNGMSLTARGTTATERSCGIADSIRVSYVPLSFSGPVLPSDDWTEN